MDSDNTGIYFLVGMICLLFLGITAIVAGGEGDDRFSQFVLIILFSFFTTLCAWILGTHMKGMEQDRNREGNHYHYMDNMERSTTVKCRNCRKLLHTDGYCNKCYMNLLKYMEEKKSGKKFKILKEKTEQTDVEDETRYLEPGTGDERGFESYMHRVGEIMGHDPHVYYPEPDDISPGTYQAYLDTSEPDEDFTTWMRRQGTEISHMGV